MIELEKGSKPLEIYAAAQWDQQFGAVVSYASQVSLRNIPLCPITRAAFGACARASSNAAFHSNKSSEVSACMKQKHNSKYRWNMMMHYFYTISTHFFLQQLMIKLVGRTLRVKARPSRPSGKRTVNNFLSSLTTTLHKKYTLI